MKKKVENNTVQDTTAEKTQTKNEKYQEISPEYFETQDISTQIIQRCAEKPNLCLSIPGKKAGKLLWLGHLDVVPPGDTDNLLLLYSYSPSN